MSCTDWEERIALYAGGDLPAAEAAEVEQHLGECAGCQILLGGLRESLELLREGREEPVGEAHFAAVRARVLSELERESIPWWRRAWVYAAVAAAVVVLALSVRHKPVTQAVLPPATSQAESKVALSVEPGAGTAGTRAHAASTPAHGRRRPNRKPAPTEIAGNQKQAGEPLVVKVITDDPEVIIYWITDTKGE